MPRPRRSGLGLAMSSSLSLSLALVVLAGCEEPRHTKVGESQSTPTPAPAQPAPDVVQPRAILGQKTQDIRDADVELKKGGQVASQKIVARDPITLPGNAYVSIVGRNSILNIKHAIDLYQAENGRYPKDYKEFMDEIIKKNNIALPTLPYYQEYGYNAEKHELIVLEYPDRKDALQKQDDAKYGR